MLESKDKELYDKSNEIKALTTDVNTKIEEINERKKEYEKLEKYLERKRRKQFKKGKVIYIIRHNKFKNQYKVGIANTLTSRVSTYNTHAPEDYEVIYSKYTNNNSLVEVIVKRSLTKYLYSNNKEWYEISDPQIIIDKIESSVDLIENE